MPISQKNDIFGIFSSRAIGWYLYGYNRGGGGIRNRKYWGIKFLGPPLQKFPGTLIRNLNYISAILSSSPVDWHPFWANWVKGGGSVDMSKCQRHTRLGAGRGVSQANEAAIYPKLTGLCQHEIVSRILDNWKYCGTVQASYGCLVGHVFMGVRIFIFAPQLCNTSVLDLDD